MLKTVLVSLAVSLGVVAGGLWLYSSVLEDKIGYVRNGKVVADYTYMQALNEEFEQERKVVQANVDTLQARYRRLKDQEQAVSGEASAELVRDISIAENNFVKYSQQAERELQAKQAEMTSKAVGKINAYIKKYAEEHGYGYVLGTTSDGSILHANEENDLTDKILEGLNREYEGSKSK